MSLHRLLNGSREFVLVLLAYWLADLLLPSRYIENVVEECDSPGEYFHDRAEETLYYTFNSTEGPATVSNRTFSLTRAKVIFNISGSQHSPVANVTIRGLTIRDAAFTFLGESEADQQWMPSDGDWALQRSGAVTVEGSEGFVFYDNHVTRCDGNGIFLNNYNRDALIGRNEFSWIGASAMASFGSTSKCMNSDCSVILPADVGPDGRRGNQPRDTVVVGNFVHELGIMQKQSSAWVQAITSGTRLESNVFFNLPHTGVMFIDGFGGGDELVGNIIFNVNRESVAHGTIDSWERQPYINDMGMLRDHTSIVNPSVAELDAGATPGYKLSPIGLPTVIGRFRRVHRNFLVANYNSIGPHYTDDGSSRFLSYLNYNVYGMETMSPHINSEWLYNVASINLLQDSLMGNGDAKWNLFFSNTTIISDSQTWCTTGEVNVSNVTFDRMKVYTPGGVETASAKCNHLGKARLFDTSDLSMERLRAMATETMAPYPRATLIKSDDEQLRAPAWYVKLSGVVPSEATMGNNISTGTNHSLSPCVAACDVTQSCQGFTVDSWSIAPPSICRLFFNATGLIDAPCGLASAEARALQLSAVFVKPNAAGLHRPWPYQQFAGLMSPDRAKTAREISCNGNMSICINACDADPLCVGFQLASCSPEAPGPKCWTMHAPSVSSLGANVLDSACYYSKPEMTFDIPVATPATNWTCGDACPRSPGCPRPPRNFDSGWSNGTATFDCKMRKLAYEFGQQKRPDYSKFADLYYALGLNHDCQAEVPHPQFAAADWAPSLPRFSPGSGKAIYYVDYARGDDTNTGLRIDLPKKTIHAAVTAAAGRPNTTINLRAGRHIVKETVQLTAAHSGLTIQNYNGEDAVVSGGVPLSPKWTPHKLANGMTVFIADVSAAGLREVPGLHVNGIRAIRARYPNGNPELYVIWPACCAHFYFYTHIPNVAYLLHLSI
eukprot:SAG31_NODE_69_length_28130_cov_15.318219_2_plen_950_part_00